MIPHGEERTTTFYYYKGTDGTLCTSADVSDLLLSLAKRKRHVFGSLEKCRQTCEEGTCEHSYKTQMDGNATNDV